MSNQSFTNVIYSILKKLNYNIFIEKKNQTIEYSKRAREFLLPETIY